MNLSEAVNQFKRNYIIAALIEHKGNQCAAAKAMEIHRNTLSRDCKTLLIDAGDYVQPGNRRKYTIRRFRRDND